MKSCPEASSCCHFKANHDISSSFGATARYVRSPQTEILLRYNSFQALLAGVSRRQHIVLSKPKKIWSDEYDLTSKVRVPLPAKTRMSTMVLTWPLSSIQVYAFETLICLLISFEPLMIAPRGKEQPKGRHKPQLFHYQNLS